MTPEEFRALLRQELANPETKRAIFALVVKELKREAVASVGGNASLAEAWERV